MVLSRDEARRRFPTVVQDPEVTQVESNEEAAPKTIDPDDTAEDLEAQGRITGFATQFTDPGGLAGVQASVDVFGSPEAAQAFIDKQINDFRRLTGAEVSGFLLQEFDEFAPPEVGEKTAAGREVLVVSGLGTVYLSFVIWSRGPVVGNIGAVDFSDVDRQEDNRLLARRMDLRIVRSLAGEVLEPPDIPEPEPTPVPGPQQIALSEGFDLTAMVLAVEDLPADAAITRHGFVEDSTATPTYTHKYVASDGVLEVGGSLLVGITTSVILHPNEADARAPVEDFPSPSAGSSAFETTGQQLGFIIARDSGFSPLQANTSVLDVGALGDAAVGISVEIETEQEIPVTAHVFLFSRGRVAVQLYVLGAAVRTFLEDTLPLAHKVDEHIQASSP